MLSKKFQKSVHLVRMFFKVINRDGLYTALDRVVQKLTGSMYVSKKNMRKYEAELYASRMTDLGKVVFNNSVQKKADICFNRSVDIIVCVHNALGDIQRCLESVMMYSGNNYNLIIVDDGSAEPTRDYLSGFKNKHGIRLLRNEHALGYTFAANIGLRNSCSDYSVLLNSDTIVTSNWIGKMVSCAESDEKIGLVGPLSNTASWQSVPLVINGNDDWAENVLPENISLEQWAGFIERESNKVYPRIPFLNGFCLMIKRQVITDVGFFDEEHFGRGYGEENDYCIRVREKGWSIALADDAYVYHSQSKSYSHEKRKALSKAASDSLVEKYGLVVIEKGVDYCRNNRTLHGIRSRIEIIPQRLSIIRDMANAPKKSIAFVLPVSIAGGGSNVIIRESFSLLSLGMDVVLINLAANRELFEKSYPDLNLKVVYAENEELICSFAKDYDAVVATVNFTVEWLLPLHGEKKPVLGYYAQDYEPLFYAKGSKAFDNAARSYEIIPGIKIFTKTFWNKEQIGKNHGRDAAVVGPSCAVDIFRPLPQLSQLPKGAMLRIVAMVRPSSPRRNAHMTMEILKAAKKKFGDRIDIVIFGLEQREIYTSRIERNFKFQNLGLLNMSQVSRLFNESDIFVDFSDYQAMGLTAMEAMSSGLAVIVPVKGGASSFAVDGQNALVADTDNFESCKTTLFELIKNSDLRERLGWHAISSIPEFHPDCSAAAIYKTLFGSENN